MPGQIPRILLLAALLLAACTAPGGTAPASDGATAAANAAAAAPAEAAPANAGWPVVYRQSFDGRDSLAGFAFSDPEQWRWSSADGESALELLGKSAYRPPVRSPTSIALVPGLEVADFDLEVTMLQTGRNYGHRDLCLFFGFQSPQRFYYVHLATSPDANAHNVFRVLYEPRTNIAAVADRGIDWGRDQWHRVRIERRVAAGTIRVYWDDQTEPVLSATCTELDWGRVGVGSFDDSGRIADIVVRAPARRGISGPADPFAR